jgi:hypothetical protein
MIAFHMTRYSFRAEREFGLIVGGILALLSGWWLYRGKFVDAASVTLPLSGLLIVFSLLLPRVLVYPNKAWMSLARMLAFVNTRIVLGVVFFLLFTPIGFVKRLLAWDPLNRRERQRDSYWRPYSKRQRDPRHYEKMF